MVPLITAILRPGLAQKRTNIAYHLALFWPVLLLGSACPSPGPAPCSLKCRAGGQTLRVLLPLPPQFSPTTHIAVMGHKGAGEQMSAIAVGDEI